MTDYMNPYRRCPWCHDYLGTATGTTCGKITCEQSQADEDRKQALGDALGRAMANEAKGRRR